MPLFIRFSRPSRSLPALFNCLQLLLLFAMCIANILLLRQYFVCVDFTFFFILVYAVWCDWFSNFISSLWYSGLDRSANVVISFEYLTSRRYGRVSIGVDPKMGNSKVMHAVLCWLSNELENYSSYNCVGIKVWGSVCVCGGVWDGRFLFLFSARVV